MPCSIRLTGTKKQQKYIKKCNYNNNGFQLYNSVYGVELLSRRLLDVLFLTTVINIINVTCGLQVNTLFDVGELGD